MLHAGEIIKKAVESSGFKHKVLAERLGISRQSLYNLYETVKIDRSTILKIGDIIQFDFEALLQSPAYRQQSSNTFAKDIDVDEIRQEVALLNQKLEEVKTELENWRLKYIHLHEAMTQILTPKQFKELQKKLY